MKRFSILLLIAGIAITGCTMTVNGTPVSGGTLPAGGPAVSTTTGGETGVVTNVVDGDTIDVDVNGTVLRVRYIGMNTPERGESCYQDAKNANSALVNGKTVRLVKDVSDTDQYDRPLRYVYVSEVFVNAQLVSQGYAEVVSYPPNTANFEYFKGLEIAATNAGLGCHPTGIFNDGRYDR